MKKVLAAIAILCMLVALVACTGGDQNDNNKGEKPSETESQTLPVGYIEEETWAGPEIGID